jgi:hypothetical protein
MDLKEIDCANMDTLILVDKRMFLGFIWYRTSVSGWLFLTL